MDFAGKVTRGPDELRRLLAEQTLDLRGLDLQGFRRWLAGQLARWEKDPVFVQRVRMRDLRRAHPDLRRLERAWRRAAAADAATPEFARLCRLERELLGTGKAVSGLTAALERAAPEERPTLREKRDTFQARRRALEDEQARLVGACLPRQAFLRLDAELQQCRSVIGLEQEEGRLADLLKQQGRRSGHSGEAFEELALRLTRECIVPDLVPGGAEGGTEQGVRVLQGVTLGAARTEFDLLVVRPPFGLGDPVEVLAVVEAKRNPNDLGHGFRGRQENLAWLTVAADQYDPAHYRTRRFPSGHFDRPAVHRQDGDAFVLTRDSFRHFCPEPDEGVFLERLYFITRDGPLWGLATAALSRVAFRVATDVSWDPDREAYLARLLDWCRTLAGPVEAPDVLRLYAGAPARAGQLLVVGREGYAGAGPPSACPRSE